MLDLTTLSEAIGISTLAMSVVLIALAISLYYVYDRAQTQQAKRSVMISAAIIAVVILFYSGQTSKLQLDETAITYSETEWQKQYKLEAKMNLPNYESDIENTPYYDYDSPEITRLAGSIANSSNGPDEAIKNTLTYVYDNVEYVFEDDASCIDGTAPEILDKKTGQCDTQSIVVISILRKMGIAAKPVGGCYISNPSCRLQSFAMSIAPGLGGTPKFKDLSQLTTDELKITGRSADISGRSALQKSGLHAWVTAWTPKNDWRHFEATNGQPINELCSTYHIEALPSDDKKEEICRPLTVDYVYACANIDYNNLDKFGLGTTQEVSIT